MFIPPLIADSNIFVAAGFNRDSASRRIIDAIERRDLVQVWNDQTRRETLHVVRKIPPLNRDIVEPLFRDDGYYPKPTEPADFEIIDDEGDRKFAALAKSCAVILVSNDSDFLAVRDKLDISVLRPSAFVQRVAAI